MMLGLKSLASMYTKEKNVDLSVIDLRSYEGNKKKYISIYLYVLTINIKSTERYDWD